MPLGYKTDATAILDEKSQNDESLHEDVMTTIHKLNDKWEYDEDMELFLRQLPKVELHVHLDGSFDPSLLYTHLKSSSPDSYESLPIETILPWDQSKFPIR